MIQLLYLTKKYEEIEQYVKVMQENFERDSSPQALYTYKLALLFYFFTQNNYEEAKKIFYGLLDLIGDLDAKYFILKAYCEIMLEHNINYDFYEKELLLAETWGGSGNSYINYALNYMISK